MANPLFDVMFAPLFGRSSSLLILQNGQQITGDAFFALTCRLANALQQVGVRPGDRIAAQVAKSPDALALYAASIAVGAVFLPLNPAYTDAELGYFLADATPRLLVRDEARNAPIGIPDP